MPRRVKLTPESLDVAVESDTGAHKKALVGKIADLMERSGLSPEDIGRIHRVNAWQGMIKVPVPCERCHSTGHVPDELDDDGREVTCPACAGAKRSFEPQTVDMVGIKISPAWEEGPKWPVIEPGKPVVVRHRAYKPPVREGFKVAMTLPDMQIGYFRNGRGEMIATHDEAAIAVALQMVAFVKPDVIVLHGDNLDLPEFSKYRLSPRFVQTTQPTVERGTRLAAELRDAAGPECEIYWLEGNHEARMSFYVMDNAKAAFGLRRGASAPGSWPVLSVPELCRLDDHGIVYLPGYPANEHWINDRLRVIHGHQVVSNGSTAHKYLAHERVSTVFGHIHRREWAERTRRTRNGSRTILALSPGCLCRRDGVVPSTKGGTDLDGMPVSATEDWQQGLAVFSYEPGDGRFVPEQVPILDGWSLYHGRVFQAPEVDAAS